MAYWSLPQNPHGFQPVLLGPTSWVVAHPASHQKLEMSRSNSQPSGGSLSSTWLQWFSTVPGTPRGVWLLSLYISGKELYVGDTQMPT